MAVPTTNPTKCHSVLVVDGQELVADSLARAIDAEDDLVFVGSATTVSDACRVALEQRPDVVIIDARLPDGTGLRASAVIRHELPDTGIVMLSGDADGPTLAGASDSGCIGFASKAGSFDDLIESIRQVATGDIAPPATDCDQLARERRGNWSDCCGLTRREFEVLQLLADGCSTNYIVEELVLSVHTVRNHIRNILAKLGAQSRLEAVAIATRLGLVRTAGPERDGGDAASEH